MLREIEFRIEYSTEWGEELFVCGSIEPLGNWDVDGALRMKYLSDGVWVGKLRVSPQTPFEYKYLMRNSNLNSIRWEDCQNRFFSFESNFRLQPIARLRDSWGISSHTALFSRYQLISRPIERENIQRMKRLFVEETSLEEHREAQEGNPSLYYSVLYLLLQLNVELSLGTKSRILAACFERKDRIFSEYLMSRNNEFSLPDILKALKLVDSNRKVREISKKLERMRKQGSKQTAKMGQMQSTVNDLTREKSIGSVSGALAKHIREWIRTISSEKLTFYLLDLPRKPWQELANIVHPKPSDFALAEFLPSIFGEEPPKGSIFEEFSQFQEEVEKNPQCPTLETKLVELIKKWKPPYSFLRRKFSKLITKEAKIALGSYLPLETLLWWYDEISCEEVDEKIKNKLVGGEDPSLGYGAMVERLMHFEKIKAPFFHFLIPVAAKKLSGNLFLDSPIAIFGDASASMQVAIDISNIISSFLTALTKADLKFFDHNLIFTPLIPRSIEQVMALSRYIRSGGSTSPAAALYPLYKNKIPMSSIIVVTDEEENQPCNGFRFAELFKKYREEVYPAKLVFISLLSTRKGAMVEDLERIGIPCSFFTLSISKADLTRLDSFIGEMAADTFNFYHEIEIIQKYLQVTGSLKEGLAMLENAQFRNSKYLFFETSMKLILYILDHPYYSTDKDSVSILWEKMIEFAERSKLTAISEKLKASPVLKSQQEIDQWGEFFNKVDLLDKKRRFSGQDGEKHSLFGGIVDDVLIRILSKLGTTDLQIAGRVCSRWRKVIQDPKSQLLDQYMKGFIKRY